ncbi:hypothetical protein ACFL5V_06280 [Fibrobacterota bacterium]
MIISCFKPCSAMLVVLIAMACVFEEENPDFDYNVKYGEAFAASPPSIEIDEHNQVHILANAYMLYAKENAGPSTMDILMRNTVTYHYALSGQSFQIHNFQNMLKYGHHQFLFGRSGYSDNLYAVIKDLDKLIIYSRESGRWERVRSVSTEIENIYQFQLDNILVNNGDVYMPFFSFDYSGKNSFEEEVWGWQTFAGLQINQKRILNYNQVDFRYQGASSQIFIPKHINGACFLPVCYYLAGENEHMLYLYRASKDSITQEALPVWKDKDYVYAHMALVEGQSRLYVSTDDSLYIYDIDSNPAELISSELNDETAKQASGMEAEDFLLSFSIDRAGCYHSISSLYLRDILKDTIYIDGTPYIKDSGDINNNALAFLNYTVECADLLSDTISVPDSLADYQFSPFTSFVPDQDGTIHIAALLHRNVSGNSYGYTGYGMGARLYHIANQTGEWVFTRVEEK